MQIHVNLTMGTEVKVGQHYAFRYEYPDSGFLPELRKHHGQVCLVYAIDCNTINDPVFKVRFPDGYEDSAFASELEDADSLMTPLPRAWRAKPAAFNPKEHDDDDPQP